MIGYLFGGLSLCTGSACNVAVNPGSAEFTFQRECAFAHWMSGHVQGGFRRPIGK